MFCYDVVKARVQIVQKINNLKQIMNNNKNANARTSHCMQKGGLEYKIKTEATK